MTEATIESGFATVAAGDWLMGRLQPVAFAGRIEAKGLKGLFVPDRAAVRVVRLSGEGRCASADAPFLTRLDALPDEPLKLASVKLLVAPLGARCGARSVRLVPLSFARSLVVTEFKGGWAVAATRGRVVRVALAEGDTMFVRPESVVAWVGRDPTGFCPKLSLVDLVLPRLPQNMGFTFLGPSTVWFEGASADGLAARRRRGRGVR